jgi:hypothetical protein
MKDPDNPPVNCYKIKHPSQLKVRFTILDDAQCIGGTKQRLLCKIAEATPHREIVYAGTGSGYAQVAMGYATKLYGKKGTLFLNGSPSDRDSPLCKIASSL